MQLSRIQPKEPSQKVSLAFKESTVDRLQQYMGLYKQTYGEDISRQDVVEHMVLAFMNRDKAFVAFEKQLRSDERTKAKATPAPAAAQATPAPVSPVTPDVTPTPAPSMNRLLSSE